MGRDRAHEHGKKPLPDRWATLNEFIDNALVKLTRETGSGNAALVWLTLFRFADGKTGRVPRGCASERRLAEVTGLARMTVRTAIAELVKGELVTIEEPHTVRQAPLYRVWHLQKEINRTARQRASG